MSGPESGGLTCAAARSACYGRLRSSSSLGSSVIPRFACSSPLPERDSRARSAASHTTPRMALVSSSMGGAADLHLPRSGSGRLFVAKQAFGWTLFTGAVVCRCAQGFVCACAQVRTRGAMCAGVCLHPRARRSARSYLRSVCNAACSRCPTWGPHLSILTENSLQSAS
jgi:hypothetical protein